MPARLLMYECKIIHTEKSSLIIIGLIWNSYKGFCLETFKRIYSTDLDPEWSKRSNTIQIDWHYCWEQLKRSRMPLIQYTPNNQNKL